MNVKIVNTCRKTYKPDPENTVQHILERIPDKFLEGLGEVHLCDAAKESEERAGSRYVWNPHTSQDAVIEIYMGNMVNGIPFFSIFTFNAVFFFAFSDHMKRLKRQTTDPEIVSFRIGIVQYDWLYLGRWNPLLVLLKIGNYVISRIPRLPTMIFKAARKWERNEQKEEQDALK